MDKSKIEEIFEIKESFELPNRIMELIEHNQLYDKMNAIKTHEKRRG